MASRALEQRRRRARCARRGRDPRRSLASSAATSSGRSSSALAQRRHAHLDDREPVVEVLAEAARVHLRREIAVGGGDDAHVDLRCVRWPPTRRISRSCERAQELGLQLERELADLVEEQRAAVGALEGARALAVGAGEGAALVAEQLALDERARERRRSRRPRTGRSARGLASWMARARRAPCRCRSRP